MVVLIASVVGSAVVVGAAETVRRAAFGRQLERSMIRVAAQENQHTRT